MELSLPGGHVALVDDEDWSAISQHRWRAARLNRTSSGDYVYAVTNSLGKRNVLMHRLLMNPMAGQQVDHINGNRLDNRRINLRLCTHAENMQNRKLQINNTSGYRGVRRAKRGKWQAAIWADGLRMHLGTFDTLQQAHQAYAAAAHDLHGAFASP